MLRYQFASTVRVLLNLVGALLLIQFLSSQMSVGSGSGEGLFAGVGGLVTGTIFCLLGDIGRRLHRLEERANGSTEESDLP